MADTQAYTLERAGYLNQLSSVAQAVDVPAATAQTVLITHTVPANDTVLMTATVIATKADGSAGMAYVMLAAFDIKAGVANQIGFTANSLAVADANGPPTADFHINGTAVELRIQNPGTDELTVSASLLVQNALG